MELSLEIRPLLEEMEVKKQSTQRMHEAQLVVALPSILLLMVTLRQISFLNIRLTFPKLTPI